MDSVRGQLLIAGPGLLDPNFWRTVVLVVEHSDEGALGLVLNRPSETAVGEASSELGELVEPEELLFIGGPVQPSAVIVLAQFEDPNEAALTAGHAGWGPGQLDAEVERDDWILEPSRLEDAFSTEPRELWSTVLERKGGSYALVARMPADPSLN